ncbi:hypothetical protein D3C80_1644550 [compost metagenome]
MSPIVPLLSYYSVDALIEFNEKGDTDEKDNRASALSYAPIDSIRLRRHPS